MLLINRESFHERAYGRILTNLKRNFDDYLAKNMEGKWPAGFKVSYIPYMMNIEEQGISNNELSKRAMVSKPAISQLLQELLKFEVVRVEENPRDKRGILIFLTDKGNEIVHEVYATVIQLRKEHRELLGEDQYEKTIDNLLQILQWHESTRNEGKKVNRSELVL